MPNQLRGETSPYLLQHAENPVEWYPWGPEALQKAKEGGKPIFLSIGYAACHWCHVMAHESFEDPVIADVMNEHFVNIKVDREERPDLDSIYMNAVVAMTGQGGWPMSVFLTPEGEPFYGGTYYPPERRYGMPSFKEVLLAVARAWDRDQDEIRQSGKNITRQLADALPKGETGAREIQPSTLDQAARALLSSYDWKRGGWGKAPRFPQPMAVDFLLLLAARPEFSLRDECRQAATHALNAMSQGGMYDVIGGGFHRYSTDDDWLVPHFEKMLYDNALLALAYLHGYLSTGSIAFKQACTDTLDFILREMTHPQGGFYSSLDADSEGVEGKYYVWTQEEIDLALPAEADRALFFRVYPVESGGNFEGRTILKRRAGLDRLAEELGMIESNLIERLSGIHRRLYAVREERARPGTDDKVLAAWNALALRAFAEAARYLGRDDYLRAARANARFITTEMMSGSRLFRAWRHGQARHNAYLEDYAALILALLALYQTDLDPSWHATALKLAEEMVFSFTDPDGGFFDTGAAHETLVMRPKDLQDNATPSGNSLAACALLALAALDERDSWRQAAEEMAARMQPMARQHPTAFSMWLQAIDFAVGPVRQVAVIGPLDDPLVGEFYETIWSQYRPRTVAAISAENPPADAPGLLRGRSLLKGLPTVYVCQGFTCSLPVSDLEGLKRQLDPNTV